jgi:hypothetical protein
MFWQSLRLSRLAGAGYRGRGPKWGAHCKGTHVVDNIASETRIIGQVVRARFVRFGADGENSGVRV